MDRSRLHGSSDHWRWSQSPIRKRPDKSDPSARDDRTLRNPYSPRSRSYSPPQERSSFCRSRSPRRARTEKAEFLSAKQSKQESLPHRNGNQLGEHSVTIEGPDDQKRYRGRCVFPSGTKMRAVTGPWRIDYEDATDDSERFRSAFSTGGEAALIDLNNLLHSLGQDHRSPRPNATSLPVVKSEVVFDVVANTSNTSFRASCHLEGNTVLGPWRESRKAADSDASELNDAYVCEGLPGALKLSKKNTHALTLDSRQSLKIAKGTPKSACAMWVGGQSEQRNATKTGKEIVKTEDADCKLELEESARGHRAILYLPETASISEEGGSILTAPWRRHVEDATADGNEMESVYRRKGALAAQKTKNDLLRSTAASLSISYRKLDGLKGENAEDADKTKGVRGAVHVGNSSTKALAVSTHAAKIAAAEADPRIERASNGFFRAVCAVNTEGRRPQTLEVVGPLRTCPVLARDDADELEIAHHTGGLAVAQSLCDDLFEAADLAERRENVASSRDNSRSVAGVGRVATTSPQRQVRLEQVSKKEELDAEEDDGSIDALDARHTDDAETSSQAEQKERRRKPSLERYQGSRKSSNLVLLPRSLPVGMSRTTPAGVPFAASMVDSCRRVEMSYGVTAADMVAAATQLLNKSPSALPPLVNPSDRMKQQTPLENPLDFKKRISGQKAVLVPRAAVHRQRSRSGSRASDSS